MNYKSHIGWCPYCDQGWINIVNDKGNNKLLLLCDECDTLCEKPGDIQLDIPLINYKFMGNAEDPSLNEIQAIGWDKLLITPDDGK